jgi:hypothetical protein
MNVLLHKMNKKHLGLDSFLNDVLSNAIEFLFRIWKMNKKKTIYIFIILEKQTWKKIHKKISDFGTRILAKIEIFNLSHFWFLFSFFIFISSSLSFSYRIQVQLLWEKGKKNNAEKNKNKGEKLVYWYFFH